MNKPTSIAELIPHDGTMVLIGEVVSHDMDRIHCRAETGPIEQHPLASGGRLPAIALAEYGAQATAVHGGLLAPPGQPPRPGLLVGLGRLRLSTDELDQARNLDIHAARLGGDDQGAIYEFTVSDGRQVLAQGQSTIMFPDLENSA